MHSNKAIATLSVFCVLFTGTLQQLKCGQRNFKFFKHAEGRAIAGEREFPWAAFLEIDSIGQSFKNETSYCAGTLIGLNWIMTAAHCVYGASLVTAKLGLVNINNQTSYPYSQTFTIDRNNVHPYPNYYYGKIEDNIALLRLSIPVTLTDTVYPACLPLPAEPERTNEVVTMLAWNNASTLQKIDTLVIPSCGNDGVCQHLTGNFFSGSRVICADGWDGAQFCYGDDGGAMNYYNTMWQAWVVLGVAGVGGNSSYCRPAGTPTVFTRVSNYVNWIESVAGEPMVTPLYPTRTSNAPTSTTVRVTNETTTSTPDAFSCDNQVNGNYPNPDNQCSATFYMCSNGIAYEYDCPSGLVFNAATKKCDWPYNVAAC